MKKTLKDLVDLATKLRIDPDFDEEMRDAVEEEARDKYQELKKQSMAKKLQYMVEQGYTMKALEGLIRLYGENTT